MRFQSGILLGALTLTLPGMAIATQSQQPRVRAAQPLGTVPDEASAGTSTRASQSELPPNNQAAEATSVSGDELSGDQRSARTADVKSGVSVYDEKGDLVGKIVSVNSTVAVVDTGTIKAPVPVSSFAKNDKGLVLHMTRAELEAFAKKKSPKQDSQPRSLR